MRKGILFGLCLIFIACVAYAGDVLWGSITAYTSTKAVKTVPVSLAEPMKAITTASTCTIYVDDITGTGVAMAANTLYEIRTPSNVSNIVFSCTSSAGTTVTIIK